MYQSAFLTQNITVSYAYLQNTVDIPNTYFMGQSNIGSTQLFLFVWFGSFISATTCTEHRRRNAAIIVSGLASFMPKYLEFQFHQTASTSGGLGGLS